MHWRIIVVLIIASAVLLLVFSMQSEFGEFDNSPVKALNHSKQIRKRVPKIIAWTRYFSDSLAGRINWFPCPYHCDVYERSQLQEEKADAIAFHFRDLRKGRSIQSFIIDIIFHNMELPKTRNSGQIYVSFLKEAPVHKGEAENIEDFTRNFFNSTVDYRRNNFTYFDQSYFVPVSTEEDRKRMRPLNDKQFEKIFSNKKREVLALISNCVAESDRLRYIKELSRYINVSKFGNCFNRYISKGYEDRLIKSHFFVIAFENIVCKDYVTEKFWRIEKDIVPIVLRRNFPLQKAPGRAFVAADDFTSPQQLAAFLRSAIHNKEKYKKFFAYRNIHYKVQVSGFCNLCRDLHYNNVSASSHLDMNKYYSENDECEWKTAKLLMNDIGEGK